GVANRFDKRDVQWDVSRDKLRREYWGVAAAGGTVTWSLVTLPNFNFESWVSDDSHDDDEDDNPWDGRGPRYGNDAPGGTPSATSVGCGKKLRMREWVRVNFGGGAGRLGTRCSDYSYWHHFRSLVKTGAVWGNSAQYGGCEIRATDPGWGSL